MLRTLIREIRDALVEIKTLLKEGFKKMASDLDALTAQVAASVTIEQSAVTLIQGLAAQIAANANDPAAIAALAAQLQTSSAALAAAVSANTPAAPAAPATPAAPTTPAT